MPSALPLAMAVAVKVGLAIVLIGILRRGLHRRCWFFLVYLLAVLIYGSAELTGTIFYDVPRFEWPQWVWSWEFWRFEQTTFAVVKLALAIELGVRVVAAFPGTWRLARALLGAALLTTTAAVTLGGGPQQPLLASGLFVLLELTTNSVLEPLLYGHSTGISQVALLVAVLFWTWLWGPVGLLLSTPLTVCLSVLGKNVPPLAFLVVALLAIAAFTKP